MSAVEAVEVPTVPDWITEPAEVVLNELIEAGDVLIFETGNRLVMSSEHGCTMFFQLIQLVRLIGDDDERRWPWGDYHVRRVAADGAPT